MSSYTPAEQPEYRGFDSYSRASIVVPFEFRLIRSSVVESALEGRRVSAEWRYNSQDPLAMWCVISPKSPTLRPPWVFERALLTRVLDLSPQQRLGYGDYCFSQLSTSAANHSQDVRLDLEGEDGHAAVWMPIQPLDEALSLSHEAVSSGSVTEARLIQASLAKYFRDFPGLGVDAS